MSTLSTAPAAAPHAVLRCLPLTAGPVTLRPLCTGDLSNFLAYRSDPVVARYQGWRPMDAAQASAFLAEMAAPPAWAIGTWVQIGIACSAPDAGADTLVGDIGLLREGAAQAQLGISLGRGAQGRGWAKAALQALMGALHSPVGIHTLRAVSDARNHRSLGLFMALGFIETGRERVQFHGEDCTEVTLMRKASRSPSA